MLVLAALPLAAWAQAGAGGSAIRYQPSDPNAPAATVGGSIRGSENDLSLTVIAPPGLAATISPRPVIYWHASNRINVPVELVLIEEGGEEALAEVRLDPPLDGGMQAFELPDNVSLEVGKVYQFSVAAVADENVRSNDVFASTLLQHAMALLSDPSGGPLEKAQELAAAGVWYDALALLEQEAENSAAARALRDELLRQVGLGQVLN
ncbi:MAG: DUF928 domain-containing protein [Pseudomonadota bacterium]